MRFTKMHGAGNDYVYIDGFTQTLPKDLSALAVAVSDRHKGIGADGLIAIEPSAVADARMRIWNADGSPAEMCGNGVRCVAKYLYDRGLVQRDELTVETGRGLLTLQLWIDGGRVERVRVNMGTPIFESGHIPTTLAGDPPADAPLTIGDKTLAVTCLSMGNPHCVVFVDELNDRWVLGFGPGIERHPAFPQRVNVEFVHVISPTELLLRVWERGSGETQACGTGACAALVAGVLTGRCQRAAVCHLPGGDLELEWSDSGDVYLTGPAVEVFTGDWPDRGLS